MSEIYTAAKNFKLPLAVPAVTILTSAHTDPPIYNESTLRSQEKCFFVSFDGKMASGQSLR